MIIAGSSLAFYTITSTTLHYNMCMTCICRYAFAPPTKHVLNMMTLNNYDWQSSSTIYHTMKICVYMQSVHDAIQRYSPTMVEMLIMSFQVNCCWFPGVAPFLVGHLSVLLAHVHKSQRTSSVCLALKKWKGSTIQPRDSLCVLRRGSKRQGESSSTSHSQTTPERSKQSQLYSLLVSEFIYWTTMALIVR